MWGEVIRYAEVTSTNDLARHHAWSGAAEGTMIVARYQASGRGRQGHNWQAPADSSLLTSTILRPPPGLVRSAWLTLGGGVAVAHAVRAVTGLEARLKWPNDVRYGGRKLAGVLAETCRVQDSTIAIVGIGLNVRQDETDFAPDLAGTATSLKLASGRDWSSDELLDELRRQLQAAYHTLLDGPVEALRRQWTELDETVGQAVLVKTPDGDWRGRAVSLDEHGALWVEDAAGESRRVVVGDVSIVLQD